MVHSERMEFERQLDRATVSRLAHALWDAERSVRPLVDWPQHAPALTEADAYAIRRETDLLRMASGVIPVGRRIGMALGPDGEETRYWCYVFSGRRRPGWPSVCVARFIQPRVVAALALELRADWPNQHAFTNWDDTLMAVRPALEIIDSRTSGLQQPELTTSIADSGRHALLVLGEQVGIADIGADARLTIRLATATTRGPMARQRLLTEDTRDALRWLATTAAEMGEPLRRGEVVLNGWPTQPQPLLPDQEYWAELAGAGPTLHLVGLRTAAAP